MASSEGSASAGQQPDAAAESTNNQSINTDETKAESSQAGSSSKPSVSCAKCGVPESDPEKPLKPCLMCKSVSYCSRECKKAHYKQHKNVCAVSAQEYAKTADTKPASRAPPKKDAHRGGLQKWQFDT